jgi:hypothetical protein
MLLISKLKNPINNDGSIFLLTLSLSFEALTFSIKNKLLPAFWDNVL